MTRTREEQLENCLKSILNTTNDLIDFINDRKLAEEFFRTAKHKENGWSYINEIISDCKIHTK